MDDRFEYVKQIGHGAYGVVCSAYDHDTKTKVAIKKVPKAFEDLIDAKRIVREIKLLSKCAGANMQQSSLTMKILSPCSMSRDHLDAQDLKIYTSSLI